MKEVSFTIQGYVHRMDVSKLRELIQRLSALVVEAERAPAQVLMPPTLNADGQLDLDAIREFMSQWNANPAWLRNNANKLWAQLGKLSARSALPFDVYCTDCGQSVREICPAGRWHHVQGEARCFVMTPATILEHGPRLLRQSTPPLGPKTLEHFEALLHALQAGKDGREA